MNSQRRSSMVVLIGGVALVLGSMVIGGSASANGHNDKVTICHATNSETNPYTNMSVDTSAADGKGANDHSHHTGPVWYPGAKSAGVTWGDIIPPVSHVTNGLNWTAAGQLIWHNDCQPVPPTTTQPPTTEPPTTEPPTTEPPTTEPPTTEPPTTEPATTEPPTTEPATTTTLVDSEGPTTTDPATTTTLVDSEGPTTTAVDAAGESLPGTGSSPYQGLMLATGMSLVGFGSLMLALSRRRT